MVGAVGVEPTTNGLKGRCSTTELHPQSLSTNMLQCRLFCIEFFRPIYAKTVRILAPRQDIGGSPEIVWRKMAVPANHRTGGVAEHGHGLPLGNPGGYEAGSPGARGLTLHLSG